MNFGHVAVPHKSVLNICVKGQVDGRTTVTLLKVKQSKEKVL